MSGPRGKEYTATHEGVEYTKTITEWVRFLKSKPIYAHLSYNAIRQRFGRQDEFGYSSEECLGIVEMHVKRTYVHGAPLVSKSQIPTMLFRQSFLSTPLVKV